MVGSSEDLLAPDTIINVSGEDGDLHAEMPAYLRPAPWRPQIGLPLPAMPAARRRDLLLQDDDEPTLINLPPTQQTTDAPVRFKIRLANDAGSRNHASYLIEKMYGWRGYTASGPKAAPNRVTLVASDAERALGTITVGFDSHEGLVVDDLYRQEVDSLRVQGAILCEFTKLAVDRNQQSKELLAMMFHIAYMYARRLHRCTDLLIEVNPRHVRFYQRMLGFEKLGDERSCPRVGGAPAVLLWLRLQHAQEQIARYGGQKDLAAEARTLYPFVFSLEEEDGIVGRLKAIG